MFDSRICSRMGKNNPSVMMLRIKLVIGDGISLLAKLDLNRANNLSLSSFSLAYAYVDKLLRNKCSLTSFVALYDKYVEPRT